MTETPSYRAVALQTACRAITPCRTTGEARARIAENIKRVGRQIPSTIAWTGPDTRLVVLPEYLFTGFPTRETADEWIAKACFADGCVELESLGAIAQSSSIYLAGNAYELDDHFPGIFFQTSFVIDPSGNVVLKYRRLNSMYSPTPHDVWDAYLDRYGLDGVFPVATTEIGRLAAVASEEILYPEVSRCLAMRGAEILVHSTCEVGSPLATPKGIAKRARAIENLAFVVSANTAGMEGLDLPSASADGMSCIVDFKGKILAEAGYGESCIAYADIDLEGLRRYRRRPGMENLLSRQRFETYAASYAQHTHYPANTMADGFDGRAHFIRTQAEVIERLEKDGII
jgi:predicted amidohydrolase